MWRKAHAAILAVEKDIKRHPSGRIVNMPRLKETTAQQELEAVIRGERPVVPPEMVEAAESPPDRNFDAHPYIKRMEYRGGGYAILMALHCRARRPRERQFAYKAELVREAQPFCDVSMLSSDGWARGRTCGWASHRSLLAHRLVVVGRGPTGGEEFRLTDDGRLFLEAMLRKWPVSDSTPRAQGRPGQPADAAAQHADAAAQPADARAQDRSGQPADAAALPPSSLEPAPAEIPTGSGPLLEEDSAAQQQRRLLTRAAERSRSPRSLQDPRSPQSSLGSRSVRNHEQQETGTEPNLNSSVQGMAGWQRCEPRADEQSCEEDLFPDQNQRPGSTRGNASRSRSPRGLVRHDGSLLGFEEGLGIRGSCIHQQAPAAFHFPTSSDLEVGQSRAPSSEARCLQSETLPPDVPPTRRWLRNSLKVRPSCEDESDHQRICSVPTPFSATRGISSPRVQFCNVKRSPDKRINEGQLSSCDKGIVEVSSDEELDRHPELAEGDCEERGAFEPSATPFKPSESTSKDGEIERSPQSAIAPRLQLVRLLVDDRERVRDADPRGILDRVARVVKDFGSASRQRLRFGDFMWASDSDASPNEECIALSCVIERKKISDLVGRSATGAHIRQLERLESCGLPHPFLLIEGNPKHASACPVYDEQAHAGECRTDAIRCEEDIDELCARMFVTQSRVGVIATQDIEGTARILGNITAWLAVAQPPTFPSRSSIGTLREFEVQAAARAGLRDELAHRLQSAGIPALASAAMRRRFSCFEDARESVLSCTDAGQRVRLFDFAAACDGVGEKICVALGVQVPLDAPTPLSEAAPRRVLHINASRALLRRLGPPVSSEFVLTESASVNPSDLCCEMVVHAGARRSEAFVVVVLPGSRLLEAILDQATRLGAVASPVALARAAAKAFSAGLPAAPSGRRMVVLEGLRPAVRAAAREATGGGEELQRELLPRLLGVAEFSALLLDLEFGWRARVHETRPAEATKSFLRSLAHVALEEAMMTLIV